MKTAWEVRPVVAEFDPYEPGLSIQEIRDRYGLEKVIKLASNENPFGVSPQVLECLREKAAEAFRYPAALNPPLVKALAEYYQPFGIGSKRFFVGDGSDEIIDLLFRVRTSPGVHNAVAFKPCFGLYETQAKFHGCELRQAPLREDFSFDFNALLKLVDENTALVLVTSPDNPSARLAPKKDLVQLAKSLPAGCLLVVDEAYIEFAGNEPEVSLITELNTLSNVAVMRTFSKVYGLAGMRVGYIILPEQLADYMWRVRLPFSVNILAQEAAVVALHDDAFRRKTIEQVTKGRRELTDALEALGCLVIPSSANFLMFRPLPKEEGGKMTAKELNLALLEKGMIIRSLGGYHLPEYLRVTVGTDEENAEFLRLVRQFLK